MKAGTSMLSAGRLRLRACSCIARSIKTIVLLRPAGRAESTLDLQTCVVSSLNVLRVLHRFTYAVQCFVALVAVRCTKGAASLSGADDGLLSSNSGAKYVVNPNRKSNSAVPHRLSRTGRTTLQIVGATQLYGSNNQI